MSKGNILLNSTTKGTKIAVLIYFVAPRLVRSARQLLFILSLFSTKESVLNLTQKGQMVLCRKTVTRQSHQTAMYTLFYKNVVKFG